MKPLSFFLVAGILLLAGCATTETPVLVPVSAILPPLPEGVFDVLQVAIQPRVTRRVAPQYPYALRSRGIGGEVKIFCIVGPDGRVGEVFVTSATNSAFAQAAADAIRQWSFIPAQVNGKPVACRVWHEMSFNAN